MAMMSPTPVFNAEFHEDPDYLVKDTLSDYLGRAEISALQARLKLNDVRNAVRLGLLAKTAGGKQAALETLAQLIGVPIPTEST